MLPAPQFRYFGAAFSHGINRTWRLTMKFVAPIALAAAMLSSPMALADINVGVTLSATGPAASLGIPEKNTIALMPKTIAGQKINYIVLDDASDTTAAVANARKLITQSK